MQLLLLVLIGFGVFKLFSSKHKANVKTVKCQSAEDRLNERFINGEIDAEAYKQMKETIGL